MCTIYYTDKEMNSKCLTEGCLGYQRTGHQIDDKTLAIENFVAVH